MGILKWIDNHIRESNARWAEDNHVALQKLNQNVEKIRREKREREAEERRLKNLECCANCKYHIPKGLSDYCSKQDAYFGAIRDLHTVRCEHFWRKMY